MAFHENTLSLLARDVANFTSLINIEHGVINASHTSTVSAGWSLSTLPMPYPLVIVSSLVSLVVAIVGWKTAVSTWQPPENQTKVIRPEGFDNWTWRQRWDWSIKYSRQVRVQATQQTHIDEAAYAEAHLAEHVPLHTIQANEPSIPTVAEHHVNRTPSHPVRWHASKKNKALVILSVAYNTTRAVFAIVTTLQVAITRNGTRSAVSSLFLLYLSFQTFISNRKLPRLITLVVVIDLVLVGVAFFTSAWDWHPHSYGDAVVQGGNCPVYAYDCASQAQHWTRVGCGAPVPPAPQTQGGGSTHWSPNPSKGESFYPPYGTGGDINSKGGQNTLRVMEAVIGGCGTLWVAVTLPATLYEAVRVFASLEGISHLLWPIPTADQFATNRKTGKVRKRMGWFAMSMFALFALPGAFLVTVLSIAGHIAGETHTYTATYIDGFGPAVNTIVTYSAEPGFRNVNSTAYWGNATSWSDCFSVKTMASRDGFFSEWLEHNEQVAFRLAALL